MPQIKNWKKVSQTKWQYIPDKDFILEISEFPDDGFYQVDVWNNMNHVNIDVTSTKDDALFVARHFMKKTPDITTFWSEKRSED